MIKKYFIPQSLISRSRQRLTVVLAIVIGLCAGAKMFAECLPNPYRAVDGWAKLT